MKDELKELREKLEQTKAFIQGPQPVTPDINTNCNQAESYLKEIESRKKWEMEQRENLRLKEQQEQRRRELFEKVALRTIGLRKGIQCLLGYEWNEGDAIAITSDILAAADKFAKQNT